MPTLNFTVDAALLEDRGKRLVGRPSTALAELIKNSYDADATLVRVLMDTQAPGKIVVSDNDRGMTIEEFSSLWMRLGSTHKTKERVSRRLRRPLTGSKGVGRIAAQLLSHHMRIESVSHSRLTERLEASLNWDEAVKAGDLVSVQVKYDLKKLGSPASPGTSVVMSKLRQPWTEDDVSNLARDVWRLQPPFRGRGGFPQRFRDSVRGD